jgi:hypothetical protein
MPPLLREVEPTIAVAHAATRHHRWEPQAAVRGRQVSTGACTNVDDRSHVVVPSDDESVTDEHDRVPAGGEARGSSDDPVAPGAGVDVETVDRDGLQVHDRDHEDL